MKVHFGMNGMLIGKVARLFVLAIVGCAMVAHASAAVTLSETKSSASDYVEYSHLGSTPHTYNVVVPNGKTAHVVVERTTYQGQNEDRAKNRFYIQKSGVNQSWTGLTYETDITADTAFSISCKTEPYYHVEIVYSKKTGLPIGSKNVYWTAYYCRYHYNISVTYKSSGGGSSGGGGQGGSTKPNYATVSFVSDGNVVTSRLFAIGYKYTGSGNFHGFPELAKPGYTFLGWRSSETNMEMVVSRYKVSGDCTLYALWGKNSNITSITGFTYGTDVNADERDRAKWSQQADGSYRSGPTAHGKSTWMTASVRVPAGGRYLSFRYKDSASNEDGLIVMDGTDTLDLIRPNDAWSNAFWDWRIYWLAEGQHDLRWTYKRNNARITSGSNCVWVSSICLAKPSVTQRVAFEADDVAVSASDYEVGEAYGTLPTPSREGYAFDGWFADSQLTERIYASTIVSASVTTLYAKWTPLGPKFMISDGVLTEVVLNGATSIVIPSTVTEIADGVFSNQDGLKSVEIPSSVVRIGEEAFWCCSSLETVTLSEGLREIDNGAFAGCLALNRVKFPDSLERIGLLAFFYSGLFRADIPVKVNDVGAAAFGECSELWMMTVDKGNAKYKVTNDGLALIDMDSATLVQVSAYADGYFQVPSGVKDIGALAFCGASKITSVRMPASVERINLNPFDSCDNLESIYFAGNAPSCYDDEFEDPKPSVYVLPASTGWGASIPGTWKGLPIKYAGNCKVEFDANGGTGTMSAQTFEPGVEQKIKNNSFTQKGCLFSGWSTSPRGTVVYKDQQAVSIVAGMILYAQWKLAVPTGLKASRGDAKQIHLEWDAHAADGDVVFYVFRAEENDLAKAQSVPGVSYSHENKFDDISAQSGVVYYYWIRAGRTIDDMSDYSSSVSGFKPDANTCVVTYEPGASGTGSQQIATKTKDVALALKNAIFTRTGYTQTGWSTSDGGTKMYDLGASYAANAAITLYPFWTANKTYILRLHRNNSPRDGATAGRTYTIGKARALPKVQRELKWAPRKGYDFLGWSKSATAATATYTDGQSLKDLTTTAGATVHLYAVWKPHKYIVRLHRNNSKNDGATTGRAFDYDQVRFLPTMAELKWVRSGYMFLGWSQAQSSSTVKYADGLNVFNLSPNDGEELHIWGVWKKAEANAYLLRLHRNNSERDGATAGRQLKLNTNRKLPTVRELGWSRTDATFKGWATTAKNAAAGKVTYNDGATVKNLVSTQGDTAHIYAVWQ